MFAVFCVLKYKKTFVCLGCFALIATAVLGQVSRFYSGIPVTYWEKCGSREDWVAQSLPADLKGGPCTRRFVRRERPLSRP